MERNEADGRGTKKLTRILLVLAHLGKEDKPQTVIPKISQESLAEIVGTTRSRASFFMNRFRKLGFVEYDRAGMQVPTLYSTKRCTTKY